MIVRSLQVGLFLAVRQIRRASLWSTLLIIFVMTLTFLNLVVVNGLLVGLPAGSTIAYETQYSGNLLISTPTEKEYIKNSQHLITVAESLPQVTAVSPRYLSGGTVEAGFNKLRRDDVLPNQVGAEFAGVNPEAESAVTGLRDLLVEGEYLTSADEDAVLLGSSLLSKYSRIGDVRGFEALKDVAVGSKIRVRVAGVTQDVWVKGVVKAKIGEVERRVFFTEQTLRQLLGRRDYEVNEVAITVAEPEQAAVVRDILKEQSRPDEALIQTSKESQGEFLEDIESTFSTLGTVIGATGLVVASITVFIVIFINALMRKKYIGILKGIGIEGRAIEFSYILQALFYALVGSGLGVLLLYGLIKPYFDANPIDFPLIDGLLVAPLVGTAGRVAILVVATMVAGYIPAKLIIRGNTLDAILGRG